MHKLAVILFLLITNLFFGQESKSMEDKILYEKGQAIIALLHEDYYFFESLNSTNSERKKQTEETYNFITSQALVYLNKLILDYPDSEYYLLALFEKGKLEMNLDNKKVAKVAFLEIVNSGTKEWKYYTNKSLLFLTALAIEDESYQEAQKYLDLRKENGLNFFCGVERDVTESQIKNMYDEIQEGLKKK